MSQILLTGGTGTLGRAIRRHPLMAQRSIRVLSRNSGPDVVTGNLVTGEGVAEAVRDTSVIVHCASGRGDVAAARNLIAAADGQHLVYISIVGVDKIPLGYYRSKLAVEQLIAGSGQPFTILRATQFHDLVFRLFNMQRWLPTLLVPKLSLQPIDVHTVADRMAGLAAGPPLGRVDDLGGPEMRTASSLASAYLYATGQQRHLAHVGLPGKTFATFRAGHNLTQAKAVGTPTFEDYLKERPWHALD